MGHIIATTSLDEISKWQQTSGYNSTSSGKSDGRTGSKQRSQSSSKEGTPKSQKVTPTATPSSSSKLDLRKQTSKRASASAGTQMVDKIEKVFEAWDADRSGFLSAEEFVAGLKLLPKIFETTLPSGNKITVSAIESLAEIIGGEDGVISILELLDAFCFEDVHGEGMADSLAEHMLTVLFRCRQAIRAGARHFDKDAIGEVTEAEFEKVLLALSRELEKEGLHFNESQIRDLCEAISTEPHGRLVVEYEKFFQSVEVVDTQDSSVGVKLSDSH